MTSYEKRPGNTSDARPSRREFLGYGGAVAGGAILASGAGVVPARGDVATDADVLRTLPAGGPPGDRNLGTQVVFPPDAFMHNNPDARIIDITKLAFLGGPNATPNDASDDDADAFNFVLRFIRDRIEEFPDLATINNAGASFIIYVPNGTYHVGKPITPPRDIPRNRWALQRIVGQSRSSTIIKLKNNTAAFGDPAHPRPVLKFRPAREAFRAPRAFQHMLRTLTVDTGSGNPGARGVVFLGANMAEIAEVTIRCSDLDPQGHGPMGLYLRPIASGWYHDITIEGFQQGINMSDRQLINPALEYVTLSGQKTAGVWIDDAVPNIRALASSNTVPAVVINGVGAHLVLVDSSLDGGSAGTPAIDMKVNGHVFARDVAVSGYNVTVRRPADDDVVGNIDEWVSDEVFTLDENQPPVSLGLPVEDPPPTPWPPTSQWANVNDFGASGDGVTDDSAAIQAACNSGKPVVYFPSKHYRMDFTVNVKASVHRLALMFTTLYGTPDDGAGGPVEGSFFRVFEDSPTPLVVDDLQTHRREPPGVPQTGIAYVITHTTPRTVVMNNIWAGGRGGPYRSRGGGVENGAVFFNDVQGYGASKPSAIRHQIAWARGWHPVGVGLGDTPHVRVGGGGILWVLGGKVESRWAKLTTNGAPVIEYRVHNGTLEVLGGASQQNQRRGEVVWPADATAYKSVNGNISVVDRSSWHTTTPDPADQFHFPIIVDDSQQGVSRIIAHSDVPPREPIRDQWVLPLYVSYDVAARSDARRRWAEFRLHDLHAG